MSGGPVAAAFVLWAVTIRNVAGDIKSEAKR